MTVPSPYTLADIEMEIARRELLELEAIEAELAERSLSEYIRQAWHLMEPGRALKWSWYIDAIAEHLEAVYYGQIRKLLINIPPRFTKSLITCVFFVTWVWLKDATRRFMCASYSNQFAKRDSRRSRKIIQSPWYQRRWGNRFRLAQNEVLRFDNDKTGFRMATSVGGAAVGEGADISIVDDAHKPQEIHSEVSVESVIEWWKETWSSRVNDEKTACKIAIGQRLSKKDLPGYLLEEEGGWEPLILPLEYNPKRVFVTSLRPEGYDPRTEEGELLHPERISAKEIPSIKRRTGTSGYNAQYNQNPSSEEGNLFKKRWWNFWSQAGGPAQRRPDGCHGAPSIALPLNLWIIISVDAAFKDLDDSDFVAMGVWGASGTRRFLLDQVRDRLSFNKTVKELKALYDRWSPMVTAIEDKANGPAIINTLKGKIPGLLAIEPQGSKKARAAAISPQVEGGDAYLPEGAPWLDDYVTEHADFPKGDNDDQVDQTSQSLLHLADNAALALYEM